jgi:hypothetical protein
MGTSLRSFGTGLVAFGLLDVLAGLAAVVIGGFAFASPLPTMQASFILFGGLFLVGIGGLRFVAGIRNRKYRGRTLGVVALSLSFLDPLCWHCLGVPQVLSVLGLVAYLGAQGTQAFAWGEAGEPAEEVESRLRANADPGPPKKRSPLLALLFLGGLAFSVAASGLLAAHSITAISLALTGANALEGARHVGRLAEGIIRCASANGALPTTGRSVPSHVPKGMKYQSVPSDWSDSAYVCAHFSVSEPQVFQYQWLRQSDEDGVINAFADLDGDGDVEIQQTLRIHCVKQQCEVMP